jgi:hypothetical protein
VAVALAWTGLDGYGDYRRDNPSLALRGEDWSGAAAFVADSVADWDLKGLAGLRSYDL